MGILSWLTSLFTRATPPATRPGGGDIIDAHSPQREPSPRDLLAELKHTAWACASINASVCASHPPRFYVSTSPGQAAPRCATRPLTHKSTRPTKSALGALTSRAPSSGPSTQPIL